jgi:hypothetical protein
MSRRGILIHIAGGAGKYDNNIVVSRIPREAPKNVGACVPGIAGAKGAGLRQWGSS